MNITMQKVQSSQIEAIGHDAESKTLAIRFKGGAEYHYANVETEMFEAMKLADSVGSFFYKNVKPFKDKYPYYKALDGELRRDWTDAQHRGERR